MIYIYIYAYIYIYIYYIIYIYIYNTSLLIDESTESDDSIQFDDVIQFNVSIDSASPRRGAAHAAAAQGYDPFRCGIDGSIGSSSTTESSK